jgi:hypothetical protein
VLPLGDLTEGNFGYAAATGAAGEAATAAAAAGGATGAEAACPVLFGKTLVSANQRA